ADARPATADTRPSTVETPPDATAPGPTPAPPPDAAPPAADAVGAGPGPAPPGACPALTDGWMAYQPGKSLQFEGGGSTGITEQPMSDTIMDAHCTYTNKDGIELFRMTK